MALQVINGQSSQMVTVGELLHGSLQRLWSVARQVTFHVARKAFCQNLSPPAQIAAQSPARDQRLVIRRTQRYQSDANDQGDDESGAQQSHRIGPRNSHAWRDIPATCFTGYCFQWF